VIEKIHFRHEKKVIKSKKEKNNQVVSAWLCILQCLNFISYTNPNYQKGIVQYMNTFIYIKSAKTIIKYIVAWFKRQVFQKFKQGLRKKVIRRINNDGTYDEIVESRDLSHFILTFRIYRKRRAVKRIYYFIRNVVEKNNIKTAVNKFLRSVHTIQRLIRCYLVCLSARVIALSIRWDKVEKQYIHDILKLKDESSKLFPDKSSNKQLAKSSTSLPSIQNPPIKLKKFRPLAQKFRYEIESQEKRWEQIDKQINNKIAVLTNRGIIAEKSVEDRVAPYKLDESIRDETLREIVRILVSSQCVYLSFQLLIYKLKRKEYYLKRHETKNKGLYKRTEYTEADIQKIMFDKEFDEIISDKKVVFEDDDDNIEFEPFIVYKHVNEKKLYTKIKSKHKQLDSDIYRLFISLSTFQSKSNNLTNRLALQLSNRQLDRSTSDSKILSSDLSNSTQNSFMDK